jgi:hypothetical protein
MGDNLVTTLRRALADAFRLQEFLETTIGCHLRRPEQRESFATYAFGILGEGARKSPRRRRSCALPSGRFAWALAA